MVTSRRGAGARRSVANYPRCGVWCVGYGGAGVQGVKVKGSGGKGKKGQRLLGS
jgi:hypothetical protein